MTGDSGVRVWGVIHGRRVYMVGPPLPLVGHIAFGVIDRGTNVLQVRPSTLCPHNCIYCSVDAGPSSRTRRAEFLVEPEYIARWVGVIAQFKGVSVEALIDGVGEPLAHPQILEIIRLLRKTPLVGRIALETHGGFLSRHLVRKLAEAGLDRINLSLDTLDPEKARLLSGVPWYDVERVVRVVEYAVKETSIDVVLTPVVVPGINEDDMRDLIDLAKSLRLGEKSGWPTGVLIQKYEEHRYGRKVRGVKAWSWARFYKWLRELEEETGYRLKPGMEELGFRKAPKLPAPYRRGEEVILRVVSEGWHKGELLAVTARGDRVMALYCNGDKRCSPGVRVRARIVRDKDNIYVARA